MVLDTDASRFGGHNRLVAGQYHATLDADGSSPDGRQVRLYLPSRCALVLAPREHLPSRRGQHLH
jgi:hypothetical protein